MAVFGSPAGSPFGVPVGNATSRAAEHNRYPLTFGSYSTVPLDTVVMSRTIQTFATGAISITAGTGEYQINGGLWVSTPGTVEAGDLVRTRLTSSAEYETLSELEITIDGVADVFSVTTLTEAAASVWTDREFFSDESLFTD